MTKYRKKPMPNIVDAVQFEPRTHPWPSGVIPWPKDGPRPRDMSWGYIETPKGRKHVAFGDWLLTDEAGERDLLKDEDFKRMFEPVENGEEQFHA